MDQSTKTKSQGRDKPIRTVGVAIETEGGGTGGEDEGHRGIEGAQEPHK